jgi:hypothetical protein
MSGKKSVRTVRNLLGTVAILGTLAGFSQTASATASLPTSGVCGFLMSFNYPFVYLYGANPGANWGMNFIGTIDFGAKQISGNVISQNPAGSATTETQQTFNAAFTTAAGPISGSYTMTFGSGSNTQTINLIPVNNGNTILLQYFNPNAGSQDAGAQGVCQM